MNQLPSNGKVACMPVEDAVNIHLTLLSDDQIWEMWLPQTAEGSFSFSEDNSFRFLVISAQDDQWVALCKGNAFFTNVPIGQEYSVPLQNVGMLEIENKDRKYFLFVESLKMHQRVFHNFRVSKNVQISIGSHPGNDICCDKMCVSRKHAVLYRTEGKWSFQDEGSAFGSFVNGKKCNKLMLNPGDVLSFLGLKCIIGSDLIAISSGEGLLKVNDDKLQDPRNSLFGYSSYENQLAENLKDQFFNRAPRKRRLFQNKTITVEGPPMSMDQNSMPMLLRMGSSMVMGGAAALSGNYVTLLSSVLFPVLGNKFTEEQRREYEHLRVTKYTEYLEQKRQEIRQACIEEQLALNQKYPELRKILATDGKNLWERRPVDSDFLYVRLGSGRQLLSAEWNYPPRHFQLEQDDLEEKMYEIVEQSYYLEDTPIVLSLTDTNVCGLLGDKIAVRDFLHKMIAQISYFHSYDEVKMLFLLDEDMLEEMDFVRYLPHAWDDHRNIRFVATNDVEAYSLGEYVKCQIEEDGNEKSDLQKILKTRPYYVVFALNKKLVDSHEFFRNALQKEPVLGISVIAAYEDLPKETQKIIRIYDSEKSVCTTMDVDGGEDVSFSPDYCDVSLIQQKMRMIANTSLKARNQEQTMPKLVTFMEMFGVGHIEQLNPLKRWRDNNPVKSLSAPVGVGVDGTLFSLDLHEKRQGPHGLVAGMTGSGKSEFIITYILSMAVNYHPDEVAFVLIDYKGGGLTGAFDNPQTGVRLPHLVGTITNLDGASIQRSLMSIESELLRRQRIFNKVKSDVNEGTMDIYTYQKLYRSGVVTEPMPHLFIISDEFAELKQQQPEFMEKLISAARIGRSLGIHLILATQKPSGVVNDQIRSNTKFRVCLRVQERSDSMDMLKRPEAAELTDTGRFYLQVGYNEYFAMGQSAWCGAEYEPQDVLPVRRDDEIVFLDITGQAIARTKPKVRKKSSGLKQVVAVVEYLSALAKKQGICPKRLWEPELPKVLDWHEFIIKDENQKEDEMSVCLGWIDDPQMQNQYPLTIDFASCQNLLIAGEGESGKSTMLQNILYALASKLSPADFNFYILDYSSRMMKLFKQLPHCGSILQEEDNGALDEFFKLINSLIAERKKLFSELDVDNFEAARQKKRIPLVLVVIDNLVGLSNSKIGENHVYRLQSYLQNSANYGVKFIITCSRINDVSARIRQELGERICFHMKDRYDYSEMLGCKVSYVPPEIPGRGLVKWDERPLEFHTTMLFANEEDSLRVKKIKEKISEICKQYGVHEEARRLPVVKEDVEYEEFARQFKRGRIPLGYAKQTGKPVALPLKQVDGLNFYFGNAKIKRASLSNLLHASVRENMELWLIKRKVDSIFDNDDNLQDMGKIRAYDLTSDGMFALRNELTKEFLDRSTLLNDYCLSQGLDNTQNEHFNISYEYMYNNTHAIMVIIENVPELCAAVDKMTELMLNKIISLAQSRNIYIVGCFEPEQDVVEQSILYGTISRFKNIILLGGNYDRQQLCRNFDISRRSDFGAINEGVMQYRFQLHQILIPCGKVEQTTVEKEDDASIF